MAIKEMAMGLSDRQFEFLKDVAKLIVWADANGFKLTEGEGYRTVDQQRLYYHGFEVAEINGGLVLRPAPKRSKTMNSKHLQRMAHDFNVFVDGEYTNDVEKIRPLGEYWKSLDEDNVWGGDWGWDPGHFQKGR